MSRLCQPSKQSLRRHAWSASSVRGASRRGTSILELLIALVLVSTLITLVAPMLHAARSTARLHEQKQLALLELSNLLEQIATLPPEKLSAEQLQNLNLSDETRSKLGDPQLQTSVTTDEGIPGLVKVQLGLDWQSAYRTAAEPVRLTVWFPGRQQSQ